MVWLPRFSTSRVLESFRSSRVPGFRVRARRAYRARGLGM